MTACFAVGKAYKIFYKHNIILYIQTFYKYNIIVFKLNLIYELFLQEVFYVRFRYFKLYTVELQWLEHLWDHEN